jgi:hypothetical protein
LAINENVVIDAVLGVLDSEEERRLCQVLSKGDNFGMVALGGLLLVLSFSVLFWYIYDCELSISYWQRVSFRYFLKS